MRKCYLCYPTKEFDSEDEYRRHQATEHAEQTMENDINFGPVANEILIVVVFIYFSILGSKILAQHLWIGALFVIEAGFVPMISEYLDKRRATKKYKCPICSHKLVIKTGTDSKTYLSCSNDSCQYSNFKMYVYEEKVGRKRKFRIR